VDQVLRHVITEVIWKSRYSNVKNFNSLRTFLKLLARSLDMRHNTWTRS
jgi:hypothetical protein